MSRGGVDELLRRPCTFHNTIDVGGSSSKDGKHVNYPTNPRIARLFGPEMVTKSWYIHRPIHQNFRLRRGEDKLEADKLVQEQSEGRIDEIPEAFQ